MIMGFFSKDYIFELYSLPHVKGFIHFGANWQKTFTIKGCIQREMWGM
jgi:hypothetical protein